jgi:hypothetical protein
MNKTAPIRPDEASQDALHASRLAHALSLAPFEPPPRGVAALAALALLLAMCVPGSLLELLGIPYAAPGGSFAYKLHPATWLTVLALALALIGRGNPLRELGRSLAHQPAAAAYLGSVLLMILWSALRFGASGTAFFIDTLLVPGLLALLLARLDLAAQRRLFVMAGSLLIGNALLGIGEQLLKMRLIPLTAGGVLLTEDLFRASALLGHPLWAASVTGFGLFVLYRLRGRVARSWCCVTLVAALLSFGGRTSLVANLALIAPLALFDLVRHARRRGLSYREVTGGMAVAILVAGAVVGAVLAGSIGGRILGSLTWDSSAQVRTKMFDVFHYMDWPQFLFGMSPAEIGRISAHLGLVFPDAAIESFWIVLCMQVGVPLLALFAVCLGAFLFRLARRAGLAVGVGLIGFLVVASTSVSLATKSPILVVVIALAYLAGTYRRLGVHAPVDARRPERGAQPEPSAPAGAQPLLGGAA